MRTKKEEDIIKKIQIGKGFAIKHLKHNEFSLEIS